MIKRLRGTLNYPLFRYYSSAIIMWLKKFSPLFRKNSIARDLLVLYGNPERVFVAQNLFKDPTARSNEKIRNAVMAVYLTGFEPQIAYNIPPFLKFPRMSYLPNGKPDILETHFIKKLQTYSINYSVDILTEFKSDMDFILYSILGELDGGKTKWLLFYKEEYPNEEGVFFPFELQSYTDSSVLEPGNAQDITIKSSLSFRVPWAYLPVGFNNYLYEMGAGIVANQINLNLEEYYSKTTTEEEKEKSEQLIEEPINTPDNTQNDNYKEENLYDKEEIEII